MPTPLDQRPPEGISEAASRATFHGRRRSGVTMVPMRMRCRRSNRRQGDQGSTTGARPTRAAEDIPDEEAIPTGPRLLRQARQWFGDT
jgi:hypothetical protein